MMTTVILALLFVIACDVGVHDWTLTIGVRPMTLDLLRKIWASGSGWLATKTQKKEDETPK